MSLLERLKLKQAKYIYIGAAVVVAVIIIALILAFSGNSTNKKDDRQKELSLSDSIADHTFRLEGKIYKLPISYKDLVTDGWELYSINTDMSEYLGGLAQKPITLIKNEKAIDIVIFNGSENATMAKDCLVGAITVFKENKVDFAVAGGVSLNMSEDDIIKKLGTPTNQTEGENNIVRTWEIGDNAGVKVDSYFGENEKYSNITISNIVQSKEKVTPKSKAPKFLDDYTAPEEIGEKLNLPRFSFEGEVFELPVPLREMYNSGWEVAAEETLLMSGGTQTIKLKNGDKKITVEIVNPSLYKTYLEYCIVKKVICETGDGAGFELPNGVKIGLSEAKLKAAMPKGTTVQSGLYSTSYSYSDFTNGKLSINISVDNNTKEITRISVENTTDLISGLIIE